MQIDDYTITETLHESHNSVVYRAKKLLKSKGSKPVVLKIARAKGEISTSRASLKREFDILKSLPGSAVPEVYEYLELDNATAIVMENLEGCSMSKFITKNDKNKGLPLADFFTLSLEMAKSLNDIHEKSIIHKDIKSSNIFVNNEYKIKYIDFELSSILNREISAIKLATRLEGTLSYISPEQTGRMNRAVDYRSDYYSLGVVFFEMLTGKTPFANIKDPMELIHHHIAVPPESPSLINKNIPDNLSLIILKLLAKNSEDRYQSTTCLIRDLQQIRESFLNIKKLKNFTPGRDDVSSVFHLSQKLYGRQKDINNLLTSFENVASGKRELMLVGGFSGIGKTALVAELHKPIVQKGGLFIAGKFDQYRRSTPFSAIVMAFNDLVRQLLQDSEEQLERWKNEIQSALKPNGKVITDLIPDLQLIIGNQPELTVLETKQIQNRFNITFTSFINVFATKKRPLAIFLDDWQWADLASLALINNILSDNDNKYVQFICAYRDNEVDENHPFMKTITELEKNKTNNLKINKLKVEPLSDEHISELITDSFAQKAERSIELARIICSKTQGNPFFTSELLRNMYETNYLNFSHESGSWEWDVKKIASLTITDNVVQLMTSKINKLDEKCINTLKLAACVGNRFDWQTLTTVTQIERANIAEGLKSALIEGYIIPQSENYKILETDIGQKDSNQNPEFKFLHDRVHQAAYTLLSEEERKKTHLNMGRLLSRQQSKKEKDVIAIVSHYNEGLGLLTDVNEKLVLCNLNLEAAQKSLINVAYDSAEKFMDAAVSLLPAKKWIDHYDLTLNAYTLSVKAIDLIGKEEKSVELYNEIKANTQKPIHLMQATVSRISACANKGEFARSIEEYGLPLLEKLGVQIPRNPNKLKVRLSLQMTRRLVNQKLWSIKPRKSDNSDYEKTMQLLDSLQSAAYACNKNLFVVIVLKSLREALKHGYGPSIGYVLSGYNMLVIASLKKYKETKIVYEFTKSINPEQTAYTIKEAVFNNLFVNHFYENYAIVAENLYATRQSGIHSGDIEFAGYSITNGIGMYLVCKPKAINVMIKEVDTVSNFCNKYQLHQNKFWVESLMIFPLCMQKNASENKSYIENLQKTVRDTISLEVLNFYLPMGMQQIFFHEFTKAKHNLKKIIVQLKAILTNNKVTIFYFYYAVAILTSSEKPTRKELKFAQICLHKLKTWTDLCPENKLHQYEFLLGLYLQRKKKVNEALTMFNQSIVHARENGFIHEEALANEFAARLLISQNHLIPAKAHIAESKRIYKGWGANAKVEHLSECYGELAEYQFVFDNVPEGGSSWTNRLSQDVEQSITQKTTNTTYASTSSDIINLNLDYFALLKASQAISSEIRFEKLLSKLLNLIMENSGATKGILMLTSPEGSFIEGEIDITGFEKLLHHQPLVECKTLSTGIVQLTLKSGNPVVESDASSNAHYTKDAYIQKKKPKSIVCNPLQFQGKTIGAIYLENQEVIDTFTAQRMELLKIISTQAAISLVNAQQYETLEQKVLERTKTIENQNQKLEKKNKKMTDDLNIARKIQTSLLPKNVPSHEKVGVFFKYLPSEDVSGDFIDYLLDGEDGLGVFICDVCGHGVPAALYAAMVKMSLISWKKTIKQPAETINVIQQSLSGKMMESFITGAVVYIDFKNKVLRCASAGHHPTIVLKKDGTIKTCKPEGRAILDFHKMATYKEKSINLAKGDKVILYTDGLVEASNDAGEMLDEEGLFRILKKQVHLDYKELGEYLSNFIKSYMVDEKAEDDITFSVIDIY
ncbi:MAG: AAA family ATPase [Leptospirales bacterium]